MKIQIEQLGSCSRSLTIDFFRRGLFIATVGADFSAWALGLHLSLRPGTPSLAFCAHVLVFNLDLYLGCS